MDESSSSNYEFRILTIGDCGVGKTSILLRYTEDSFDETITSLGVLDWTKKTLDYEGCSVKLNFMDTSGHEKYGTLTQQYCRSGDAILLCYDVTCQDSFLHINYWRQKIGVPFSKPVILVGNKIDLEDHIRVSTATGSTSAKNLHKTGVPFCEVSAKTGHGVEELFKQLILLLMAEARQSESVARNSIILTQEEVVALDTRTCCNS